jgi:hypothetical protein
LLCRRGQLVVMDSTFKTNRLAWALYSLVVRTEEGSWVPVAHLLAADEGSEVLAEGLRAFVEFSGARWKPLFFVTDNSASEQSAVSKAFGENKVSSPLFWPIILTSTGSAPALPGA